jgi:effector-binding domain-containing protein
MSTARAADHPAPSGPPFARYHEAGDGFDVEAGFPAGDEVLPAGRVVAAVLPGGATVTAVHRGGYDTVGETYQVIAEWLTAHGYSTAGAPWESYLDEPGVSDPRTVVAFPCRRG